MRPVIALLEKLASEVRRRLRPLYHALRWGGWPFRERYAVEDNTRVTVYTAHPEDFPGCGPVTALSPKGAGRRGVRVSLVATARDERESARTLVDCLLRQTRLPDEIVVCDTGSQDGTLELLRELAARSPIPFRVVVEPGASTARGRNAAIGQATGAILAVTDLGCEPEPTWLERLAAPFEIDPSTEVSVGRFAAVDRKGRPARWWEPGSAQVAVDPRIALPPGVSIAFTRRAWESVGGYPEWLTLAAEDWYFGMELKRATNVWALVPEAAVNWRAPDSLFSCARAGYRWAVGLGEIGSAACRHQKMLALSAGWLGAFVLGVATAAAGFTGLAVAALLLTGLFTCLVWRDWRPVVGGPVHRAVFALARSFASALGYGVGFRRQPGRDALRRPGLRGVWFVLSYVSIEAGGGGSRGTQIVLELLRRQFEVVYVHRLPVFQSAGVEFRHPNLAVHRWPGVPVDGWLRTYGDLLRSARAHVLVEVPWAKHLPALRRLRDAGASVAYDLIDDWRTSLGAGWYTPEAEEAVVALADILVATAPSLQDYLRERYGRGAELLPNAADLRLFDARKVYPRPLDLPPAEWTVLYAGALWGDWFDWELLRKVAHRHPSASIVMIGGDAGSPEPGLPNLHFLGLKPQTSLPAYLAHADVAFIPWRVCATTLATSPLKLYEYLAMRLPVVVPDLPLLRGIPGVLCAADEEDFADCVGGARGLQLDEREVARFVEESSWAVRVTRMLELAGVPGAGG